MCGITGLFDTTGQRPIERTVLARMNEAQHHRGPDEGGMHLAPGIGLGHRRLSIIDLSTGQQPLYNEDATVCVVYNGEIYNYQSLITELSAAGHRFRTRSDTEVIVHAWEEWGEACVRRFRGMFAFALWDATKQTLFLARDRLGVKPLYYAMLPDGLLLFGSELKSLVAHGALPKTLDPLAVEDYFALGYIPEPRSIYACARKLPPGCTLTLRRGQPMPATVQYWDVRFSADSRLSLADAEAELIDRLRESVRMRMIAEVPLGAFLSGGVDSSAVVAMMAKESAAPVNTCSIAFSDPAFDESRFAQQVADLYRTRHFVDRVESDDFELIDTLAATYDEPFADSSAIPTYRVCQLARRHVTVALSGDGGDESFGGYGRYRVHLAEERWRSMLPHGLRGPLFGALAGIYPQADRAPRFLRAKATFRALARDSVEGYANRVCVVPDELRRSLYSPAFARQLSGYSGLEVLRRYATAAGSEHPLSVAQYVDLKTYLVGDINTKVDRASMAHSLEVREPLMDHPLVEWLATLPPEWKMREGEGKWIFKKAMEPHLPREVLYRPKMGFAVPLARWFRGPLRARVSGALLEGSLHQTGLFDRRTLQQLLDGHQAGRRDYSAPLWSLLMFEAFLRVCAGHGAACGADVARKAA